MFKDILSSYAKILGETNVQSREFPRSGWKAEGVEEKEEEKKKKKKKKKIGQNNAQLRFVCHHGWRTQARLDQKKKKKVGENNGQLRFRPPTPGATRKPPGPKATTTTTTLSIVPAL